MARRQENEKAGPPKLIDSGATATPELMHSSPPHAKTDTVVRVRWRTITCDYAQRRLTLRRRAWPPPIGTLAVYQLCLPSSHN
ncbi:MAG: hypothetical protein Q8P67_00965 [archaeon]|nr:hypothetical protein [archaeon]